VPRLVTPVALVVAGLPLALNWRAANRRPDAMLATTFGESLLASVPPRAVLFVAGDNDSYTTWFRQAVLGERRDVVPVTLSLLPADWYRLELERRYGLVGGAASTWRGEDVVLGSIVARARETGRPVAAAVSVRADLRHALAPGWTLGGMAYVADFDGPARADQVDSVATGRVADLVASRLAFRESHGRDPAVGYVARLLRCPSEALRLAHNRAAAASADLLDSRCNFK